MRKRDDPYAANPHALHNAPTQTQDHAGLVRALGKDSTTGTLCRRWSMQVATFRNVTQVATHPLQRNASCHSPSTSRKNNRQHFGSLLLSIHMLLFASSLVTFCTRPRAFICAANKQVSRGSHHCKSPCPAHFITFGISLK